MATNEVESKSGVRGSGVKYTLPYMGRFAGLWLAVSVGAVVVASSSTFLAMTGPEGGDISGHQLLVLGGQTLFLVAALFGLAIFTTHRLAGPWIAVLRAFQDVRRGNLDRRLRIRGSDLHLKEVEAEFNAMMEALRSRLPATDDSTGS
jgi:HAMP domain-containing protein